MFGRQFLTAGAVLLLLSTASVMASDEPTNIAAADAPANGSSMPTDSLIVDEARVDDSAAVKAVLAAHPGREVIICLAGCKYGQVSVLADRSIVSQTVDGSMGLKSISSGRSANTRATAAPLQIAAADTGQQTEPVVCLAGCTGQVGVVVWRGMRLAWVREDRKEDLMAALRRLGDRLAKQDASQEISGEHAAVAKPRVWVGATAKEGLMAAFGAAPPVARFAAVSARPRG